MTTRQQSYDTQLEDLKKRKEEVENNIKNLEQEIQEMSKTKGKTTSSKKELEIKKKQLDEIDEARRKLYVLKSNLSSTSSRIEDKQKQLSRAKAEYDLVFGNIQRTEAEIAIKESLEVQREKIVVLKNKIDSIKKEINVLGEDKINDDKNIAVLEKHIEHQAKIQSQVSSLDICPLCKTKITKEHIGHVIDNAEKEKEKSKSEI